MTRIEIHSRKRSVLTKVLVAAILLGGSYMAGVQHGDFAARTDRADAINACWDQLQNAHQLTATKLYGCYSAN